VSEFHACVDTADCKESDIIYQRYLMYLGLADGLLFLCRNDSLPGLHCRVYEFVLRMFAAFYAVLVVINSCVYISFEVFLEISETVTNMYIYN